MTELSSQKTSKTPPTDSILNAKEIRKGLSTLEPSIPWSHDIDLGHGIRTVSVDNEKFRKKAEGLNLIGSTILDQVEIASRFGALAGLRVADIACGEGAHSLAAAARGAREVVGFEGRDLYLRRAAFAARAQGHNSVRFVKTDVRELDPSGHGKFDVVICSGILHHLGVESFDTFISSLYEMCSGVTYIYTHVSTPLSVERHGLQGPVKTKKGSSGHLFREYADGATAEERERSHASLDNTFSFWATERALIEKLHSTGFRSVTRLMLPHPFGWENASYRPILSCWV
jgi:SAM-dependent methyltransferase